MRILFLSHRLPYAPNRGDRVRAYHLIHQMTKWAAVDLVSLVHDPDEASHIHELRDVTASTTTAPVARAMNILRAGLALPTRVPTTHSMLHAPGLARAVEGLVASRRPDIVFAYCTGVAPLTLLPGLRSLPAVLDMVDVDSAKWAALAERSRAPLSWIYKREARLLAAFERDISRRAVFTSVVTEKEKDTLAQIAPAARIEVIPNGVDASQLKRPVGTVSDSTTVVFCGVMNYQPNAAGVTWFVRHVWPLVRQQMPQAKFTIVGSHPTPSVLALADGGTGVSVTGQVPDVRPYLWSAAVAVAPLLTARGVQNKVLEAVAAGLPVVVTSVVSEGLPSEVQASIQSADEPSAFAGAIVNLLAQTPEERRNIAARADLEALSWSRRLAHLRELLASAAGSPNLPGRTS